MSTPKAGLFINKLNLIVPLGFSFFLSACLKDEQRAALTNANVPNSEVDAPVNPSNPVLPTPDETTQPTISSSDDLPEGSQNLYFSAARVDSRVNDIFSSLFASAITSNADHLANSTARHSLLTLGASNGLVLNDQQLSLDIASSSATGSLSAADFQMFSEKESSLGVPATTGQVLTSTPGGTRSWTPISQMLNPLSEIVQLEDWLTGSYLGTFNWLRTVSGTGAAANMHPTTSNNLGRPGILELTTGTTATGRANMSLGVSAMQFGSGETELVGSFFLPNLSDAIQNFVFRFGFGDQTTGADFVDGAYFEYNSGLNTNWLVKTASNSARSSTPSLVAVTANNWIKLRVLINQDGTEAQFFINNALVHTEISNIPLGNARRLGPTFVISKTIGTTARLLHNDYVLFKQTTLIDR